MPQAEPSIRVTEVHRRLTAVTAEFESLQQKNARLEAERGLRDSMSTFYKGLPVEILTVDNNSSTQPTQPGPQQSPRSPSPVRRYTHERNGGNAPVIKQLQDKLQQKNIDLEDLKQSLEQKTQDVRRLQAGVQATQKVVTDAILTNKNFEQEKLKVTRLRKELDEASAREQELENNLRVLRKEKLELECQLDRLAIGNRQLKEAESVRPDEMDVKPAEGSQSNVETHPVDEQVVHEEQYSRDIHSRKGETGRRSRQSGPSSHSKYPNGYVVAPSGNRRALPRGGLFTGIFS